MSLSKGARLFLLTVIIAVTACVACKIFFVDQQEKMLMHNHSAIAENKQNRKELNEFFQRHDSLEKYELELNRRQRLLAKMLPEKLNVSDYLVEIQRQAADAGVVLLNVKPGKINKEKNYCTQEIFLRFQTNYYQMNAFLQAVEQEERFTQIINMKVHNAKQEALLEGEAVLLIYALSE